MKLLMRFDRDKNLRKIIEELFLRGKNNWMQILDVVD